MGLIFGLSSITNPPDFVSGADKDLHAMLYAGLGFLVSRALTGGWRTKPTVATAVATMGIAVAYGVSDELHQYFVPGRSSDVLDVVADAVGAAAAAFIVYAWGIIRGRDDL